jgi:predicted pyridoxine 5'-phosphate oxidase superfamily flavin-nucleotide-binding protein
MSETTNKLEQAMHLAGQVRHMLLATVDETGTPHLTPVEECMPAGAHRVAVQAWIDVSDLQNRCSAGRLALALWDEDGYGYQLTGQLVRLQEDAVLDGLAEIEQQTHFPQIERTLLIQVEAVQEFHFRAVAHSQP